MDWDSTSPVTTATEPTYPLPSLVTPTQTSPAVAATASGALPSASTEVTEIIGPQSTKSRQEARAYIAADTPASAWFQSPEPSIGVLDCALQLEKQGDSMATRPSLN